MKWMEMSVQIFKWCRHWSNHRHQRSFSSSSIRYNGCRDCDSKGESIHPSSQSILMMWRERESGWFERKLCFQSPIRRETKNEKESDWSRFLWPITRIDGTNSLLSFDSRWIRQLCWWNSEDRSENGHRFINDIRCRTACSRDAGVRGDCHRCWLLRSNRCSRIESSPSPRSPDRSSRSHRRSGHGHSTRRRDIWNGWHMDPLKTTTRLDRDDALWINDQWNQRNVARSSPSSSGWGYTFKSHSHVFFHANPFDLPSYILDRSSPLKPKLAWWWMD